MIKIQKYSFQKAGFTLAETLITLVVVGVVAALTVPNIIVKHQKEETVTRLKKAYSTLAQVANKSIADNGPIESWTIIPFQTKDFAEKYITPYLNVGKNCGYETTGDCHFVYAYLKTPKTFNEYNNSYYKIILQDGTALMMQSLAAINPPVSYLVVDIDINGQKGPNVYGKDIFCYRYNIQYDLSDRGLGNMSGKLIPRFLDATNLSRETLKSDCAKNKVGSSCAALIMYDGWQIKDDYPWL